jgi:alpha-1,3-glucosyltransferase
MLVTNDVEGMPFLSLLVAVLLRWCVSLHPYSGEGQPPMFGDYEAQRHWMEITRNLPLQDWYYNTSENDLMYWGLDYPPLTAYHSFFCGHVASFVNPEFVALGSSRGYESYGHKLFMRVTVLVADLFIYMPAVWWYFCKRQSNHQNTAKNSKDGNTSSMHTVKEEKYLTPNVVAMYLTFIYPGLILIDYGHFQYNGISLGLTVAAIAAIVQGRDLIASVLFCLSLNYKQMCLYHALPFFCYLLGNCLPKQNRSVIAGFTKLLSLAAVVIITFFVIWFPFLINVNLIVQVLHRLFPLARGVFEDKVSNVWCCLNVVYKFRTAFTNLQMAKLCLVVTLLAVLPSSMDILFRPRLHKFLLSVINSSLAFFLFSFQVHEKSILLAAIPVALYLPVDPLPCFWFLLTSTFSMLPLLLKDGLLISYVSLTVFYSVSVLLTVNLGLRDLLSNYLEFTPPGAKTNQHKSKKPMRKSAGTQSFVLKKLVLVMFFVSLAGSLMLTVCSVVVSPPSQYPDLFPLLISIYSCAHFIAFFAYFNYRQIFILRCNSKLKSK